VYVGDAPKIKAISKSNGTIDWEKQIGGRSIRPSLGDDVVYVSADPLPDEPGKLVGLEATTGESLFGTEFGDTAVTAPAIARESVFVGVDNGHVFKYS